MTGKVSFKPEPTPRVVSPYNLMQERYRDDPWALLVGCILFNMVHGSKAQLIHEEFLRRWSNPIALFKHSSKSEMVELLKPLGFQNRRAERILKMSSGFLDAVLADGVDEKDIDVEKLHGIGKYGADSFNMFCRGYLVNDVQDKELRNYLQWARLQGAGGLVQADSGSPSEAGGGHAETREPKPAAGGG